MERTIQLANIIIENWKANAKKEYSGSFSQLVFRTRIGRINDDNNTDFDYVDTTRATELIRIEYPQFRCANLGNYITISLDEVK